MLEPEAASISLQLMLREEEEKMEHEGDAKPALIKPGEGYLVVDCGGGTVDVVAHQWLGPFEVQEIIPPSGGPWGSINVERQFEQLLVGVFGDRINEYRDEFASDWLVLMKNFLRAKETFFKRVDHAVDDDDDESDSSDGAFQHSIDVPDSLIVFLGGRKTVKAAMKASRLGKENMVLHGRDRCQLGLSAKTMASMFDAVVCEISAHIAHCLTAYHRELLEEHTIRYVFLVGGFVESKYLEQCIEDVVQDYEGLAVRVPAFPTLAVVHGAANIDYIRTIVQARLMKNTYGYHSALPLTSIQKHYPLIHAAIKGEDDPRIDVSPIDGEKRYRYCFIMIVCKGELIKCGHVVEMNNIMCSSLDQTKMDITVLFSDEMTESFPLPDSRKERRSFLVGGKKNFFDIPEWFDRKEGRFTFQYIFAEEEELKMKVMMESGGRIEELDIDPVKYEVE